MTITKVTVMPGDQVIIDCAAGPTGSTGSTGPTGPTGPLPPNVLLYDVPWRSTGTGDRIITRGFDATHVVVLKFSIPADYWSDTLSRISGVEYGGGPVTRYSTLSELPNDFSTTLPPQCVHTNTGIAQFWLQLGGTSTKYPVVLPGKTYYMNVRNTNGSGENTCAVSGGACNMAFSVTVPV